MNSSQREHADRRQSPRVCLQLKLAVVYHQHQRRPAPPTYHGTSHDIGMSGLSMVVDHSIFDDGLVTVLLALPPAYTGAPPTIIGTLAEMTYAIHSSRLNAFKIGMAFLEFKSNGKELLLAALLRELERTRAAETERSWTGLKGVASVDFP